MPWTPNRTSIPGLIARIVMGKVTGACVAAAGGQSIWLGAVCGAVGGVVGCFGGYQARTRTVKALGKPDIYVALAEDLICVAGCLWIAVPRFYRQDAEEERNRQNNQSFVGSSLFPSGPAVNLIFTLPCSLQLTSGVATRDGCRRAVTCP